MTFLLSNIKLPRAEYIYIFSERYKYNLFLRVNKRYGLPTLFPLFIFNSPLFKEIRAGNFQI